MVESDQVVRQRVEALRYCLIKSGNKVKELTKEFGMSNLSLGDVGH